MASKIGICNLTLIRLGSLPIVSITDDSKRAIALNAVYDMVRDITLEDHPWNFAMSRSTLAQLSTAPDFGYSYQYQLPSDCLRVLGMVDVTISANVDPTLEFKIESNRLLTDETSASIMYVATVDDPALYSPRFVSAFSMRLAAEVSYHITGNASLKAEVMKEYQLEIAAARTIDAMQGTADVFIASDWINSRA
jgi:hypothetical protein